MDWAKRVEASNFGASLAQITQLRPHLSYFPQIPTPRRRQKPDADPAVNSGARS
jgi:hypothetical protein